jgi:hypothetical protein
MQISPQRESIAEGWLCHIEDDGGYLIPAPNQPALLRGPPPSQKRPSEIVTFTPPTPLPDRECIECRTAMSVRVSHTRQTNNSAAVNVPIIYCT